MIATVLEFESSYATSNVGLEFTTCAMIAQLDVPITVSPLYVVTAISPVISLLFGICAYKLDAIMSVSSEILSVTPVPIV